MVVNDPKKKKKPIKLSLEIHSNFLFYFNQLKGNFMVVFISFLCRRHFCMWFVESIPEQYDRSHVRVSHTKTKVPMDDPSSQGVQPYDISVLKSTFPLSSEKSHFNYQKKRKKKKNFVYPICTKFLFLPMTSKLKV